MGEVSQRCKQYRIRRVRNPFWVAGAPRSMKMGTTRSPWRYDAAIRHALQSANLRRPAILHYASSAAVSPISQGGPVTPR